MHEAQENWTWKCEVQWSGCPEAELVLATSAKSSRYALKSATGFDLSVNMSFEYLHQTSSDKHMGEKLNENDLFPFDTCFGNGHKLCLMYGVLTLAGAHRAMGLGTAAPIAEAQCICIKSKSCPSVNLCVLAQCKHWHAVWTCPLEEPLRARRNECPLTSFSTNSPAFCSRYLPRAEFG